MGNNVSGVGSPPTQNGLIRIRTQCEEAGKVSARRLPHGKELEITLPSNGITAAVLKSALFQVGVTCLDTKQIEKIADRNGNDVLDAEDELNDLDEYLEGTLPFDRNFILSAVKQDGLALQYADVSLKKDREIVFAAVNQNGWAFQFADESLKKDREFILSAVKQNGWALKFADGSLKKDREFILSAVRRNGGALEFADVSLKKDREIVLAAVKEDGYAYALQYADVSLKKDREIVLAAVKRYGGALQYADGSLKKDKEIVLAAVKLNGWPFQFADGSLKKDREFMLAAVKQNGWAFQFADGSLKKDREFMLAAVKVDGFALQYADVSFKKDKEIVLATVNEDGDALQYADDSTKTNLTFLEDAFNANFNIYALMPEGIKSEFTERYEKILRDLKEVNIEFPGRFRSIRSVQEIIKNCRNLKEIDPRPLAVCIYTKDDQMHAFEFNQQTEELVARGYRVFYFEARTDKEVYDALIRATTVKPAELLILAGHGTQTQIAFGADDPARSEIENEDKYIDVSDENEMREKGLSKYLAKNSVIILNSCSTGEGKEKAKNVASLMRAVFPESTIFAPTKPTFIRKFKYDKNGKIMDVIYSVGKENTYSIEK